MTQLPHGGRPRPMTDGRGPWRPGTVFVATSVTESMRIKRYVVGQGGELLPGSMEQWRIEDGRVERIGQPGRPT